MLKEKNILFALLVNYLWGKKVSSLKFYFYFAESSSLIWCRGRGDKKSNSRSKGFGFVSALRISLVMWALAR